MKKIIIILVMLLIIFSANIVHAADPLYRMTNPEYFPGDQDAMFLGKITGIEGDIVSMDVIKILNGSVESENIKIEGLFTYLGFSPENADAGIGVCIRGIQ